MDIFEKVFQYSWKKLGSKADSDQSDDGLQNLQKYLGLFSSFVLQSESFPMTLSQRFVGFDGRSFYLPVFSKKIQDAIIIKKIYVHLLLLTAASHKLQIPVKATGHTILDRLILFNHIDILNHHLDSLFPGFALLQKDVVDFIEKNYAEKTPLYSYWRNNILSRDTKPQAYVSAAKSNSEIPLFLFYSIPSASPQIVLSTEQAYKNSSDKKETKKSNLVKKIQERPEEVSLNDKEANPLAHSFEKTETTDEYSGSRKIDSDDDELEEHADSLSEVQLGKFTRDGDTTSAAFQSEDIIMTSGQGATSQAPSAGTFHYSEWNQQSKSYLKKHCTVHAEGPDDTLFDGQLLNTIQKKHSAKISLWKRKIEQLYNEPAWQKNLFLGTEINLDEVIREKIDLRRGVSPKGKWYSKKVKAESDLSICLLFDQSMSSDSWIANQRVLDVALESIAISGLLFNDLFPEVQVAGTYSQTRHHCNYKVYKNFKDDWKRFHGVMKSIEPNGYTRLGPALRHASMELKKTKCRKKLLILFTDGKPTDLDGYEGLYGIKDVWKACLEAEKDNIYTVALALDTKNRTHFSKMFSKFSLFNSADRLLDELWSILVSASQR